MRTREVEYRPVSGSCPRCGCALGFGASRRDDTWYCCGECAGGERCACDCHPTYARARASDLYVPSRRMFAARHPDYLNTPEGYVQKRRAFPFADRLGRAAPRGPARNSGDAGGNADVGDDAGDVG